MVFGEVNYWAVIVATIVNMVLGSFWYSPQFLGKTWAKAHGFDIDQLWPQIWNYVGAFFVALILAWVFSMLTHAFGVTTFWGGMQLGFWIWLGFIATTHFSGVIWAKKSWMAYLIDMGYQFVIMIILGVLLALWQ
jgi:hypothetical protein